MKKIIFTVLVSLGAAAAFAQTANSDAAVAQAADALLKSQKDAKAWQTFREIVRAEDYSPEVRSRAMYLFAVSQLLQLNTNLYVSAIQTMRARYPEEGQTLAARLTAADWLVACPACGGTGVRKGSSAKCLDCVGTGRIVQLSPRVKEQIAVVLGEIKAFVTENMRFAEASKTALAENNPQRRIAALQELVDKYAHRKDLEKAKQALAKTEADVAKAGAIAKQKKAEQEFREQEDRDYQAICSSLENLPDSGIAVMIREIDRFIEKYPNSNSRLELEINKTKLQQRKNTHAYLWMAFYVSMGLAAVAMLVSFIKGLFVRRKKTVGPLPVPGLTQTSEESDPLAGTFTDKDQF